MERIRRVCIGIGCAIVLCGTVAGAELTKHYEESLFKMTDAGLYGVELLIHDGDLKRGMNRVDIIVHDTADRDVAGASITVTPWMVSMGHGVMDSPTVTERGGGLYSIENIGLFMPGHWELRFTVSAGDQVDTVSFDFPSVGKKMAEHHGHENHGNAPDQASSALAGDEATPGVEYRSEHGLFTVIYAPMPYPVPLNRIHQWVLTVKDAGGQPVRGARIDIAGTMPAHGHGLPTRPEATEGSEPGRYVLEGMKFNMPGVWVVTLEIASEKDKDNAVITLDLE